LAGERYVIRGGHEGFERLKLLQRVRWPDTADLFDLIGLEPGWRCADLGCGGGEVTFELARLVGPDGRVTGLDMDDVKLCLAQAAADERGLANVEFRTVDVNQWSEPEEYDFVYCRMLLQHLRRPVDQLARMWAAVRPGGVVAVEDADFEGLFCDPPNDGFEFYARTFPVALSRHGGDPTAGRKLHRYFRDAEIPEAEFRLTAQRVRASGDTKTLALATLEATAAAMVAERLATEDEVEAARASLAEFVDDPETILADPRVFQCWARKPA
jgi:ubiquinone/menaquinone biosynthesis C-methylase UbiE